MNQSPWVLTFNPLDERVKPLLSYIAENRLCILTSPVSGFGRPELRIDGGEHVKGNDKIITHLQGMKDRIQ